MDREILRLAVPALGALIAEPMFLLADSAMVGHLGGTPLAGLGIASAILQTITGLMIFLAYSTTPSVARKLGAGDLRGAVASGVDSIWLAAALGCVLGFAGWLCVPLMIGAFGAAAPVAAEADVYLRISMIGLPAMLVVYAATGLLRGLQDTRTPLAVATIGFGANILLNFLFIYVAHLGIAGSATGTVVAQWGMALTYLAFAAHHARRVRARLLPHHSGLRSLGVAGGWLFLRTASLRAAMLLAVFEATRLGSPEVAAFQIAMTIYSTLAFALDALAIAAQALVGRDLGASDRESVHAVLRRCVQWGIGSGIVLGAIVVAASPVLGFVFTTDKSVLALLPATLAIIGCGGPLSGYVFVLDGVLIGAGDARYLAITGIVNLAVFVPLAVLVGTFAPAGVVGLAWLSAAFALGYLGARAVTLGARARTPHWITLGA
jgi:putative MATE family efflux protein